MAMLSMAGIIVAIDSFGPITDNAGGIAEMADMPHEVRERHRSARRRRQHDQGRDQRLRDRLRSARRNRALRLVLAATDQPQVSGRLGPHCTTAVRNLFEIGNPFVLRGLFIGGLLPYLFASLSMEAVGRAGGAVVEEVRRQFREIPGIMEGTARPNYGTTVDIVTRAALREMIVPALIPVGVPVIVVLLSYFNVFPADTGAQMMGGILRRLDRHRVLRRDLDDVGRRRVGQRQEVHRGRHTTAEKVDRAPSRSHRRHRRRSL